MSPLIPLFTDQSLAELFAIAPDPLHHGTNHDALCAQNRPST
jgi:hypothetical protein